MDTTALHELFSLTRLLQIVLIIIGSYGVYMILHRVIERVVRQSIRSKRFKTKKDEIQREDTLISILTTALKAVVWVVALLMIVGAFGVNIGPLLAGAGIAGVALGFGAQTMVRDFLAGFFIIAENQYRVGDVLQVNEGVAGVVQQISLRSTVLRDLEGKVHYIPNGNILIATNMTLDYASVDLNIGVGYDADIDVVEKIINRVGEKIYADEKWKDIVLEAPTMLRVDQIADSAIIVKIVCKTAPIHQWEVKSEILRNVKKAFDKEGIDLPYPQRVIHRPK